MKDYSSVDFDGIVSRLYPNRTQLFNNAQVKLIGIRGANAPEGGVNSFARYDDQVLVFINGSFVKSWLFSTDPSWYFVQNPIVRDNTGTLHTGQLCPGVHLFGRHVLHGKYPCFGQAEDVRLNRLNRDGSVHHIEVGDFAVCIHSGGAGMDTGRFSLACQILENPDGYFGNPTWNTFYLPIRDALSRFSLETFPYLLLNVADVLPPAATAGAIGAPVASQIAAGIPIIPVAGAVRGLLSNTLGGDSALDAVVKGAPPLQRASPAVPAPGIDKVQDALIQLNVPLDLGPANANRGFFGPKTEAALQIFQKNVSGLAVTGTVTAETLFALDVALLDLARGSAPEPPNVPPRPTILTIEVPSHADYSAPPASTKRLAGIDFSKAQPVGEKYLAKFAAFDQHFARKDPSRCRVLLQFPNGGPLYYDAKMAVDTDGSPNATAIDPNPGDASDETSWKYPKNKTVSFDAEKVPYIVLPKRDENNGDDFITEMKQDLGNLAVVIYKDKIAGAIFVDEGPTHKIGEGSVRLHEMLDQNPWNKSHSKVIDSSIEDSVLYFVFPNTVPANISPAVAEQFIQDEAKKLFASIGGTWP